ncbi:unnamed protein product, partial [Prorocentrum cordatum]
ARLPVKRGAKACVTLGDGDELVGDLREEELDATRGVALRGCWLDLEKAFNQIRIKRARARFAIFCAWDPRLKGFQFFVAKVMSFGAKASVLSFNQGCDNAGEIAKLVFELLGWVVKGEGDEAVDFGSVLETPGVEIDFEHAVGDDISIVNRRGRVEEIAEDI